MVPFQNPDRQNPDRQNPDRQNPDNGAPRMLSGGGGDKHTMTTVNFVNRNVAN